MSGPLGWLALAAALLLLGGPVRGRVRGPVLGSSDGADGGVDGWVEGAVDGAVDGAVAGRVDGRHRGRSRQPAVLDRPRLPALPGRARAGPGVRDPALPLVLDLAAAALRAGRPLPEALELAGPAGEPTTADALRRVARLLRLGAEPAVAWAGVPPRSEVSPLVPVAIRSAASGLKLAAAFERLAGELRADRAARAAARAQRAGVLAMGPLAACFLPSFVCLGVVPVVVGIAAAALGTPS